MDENRGSRGVTKSFDDDTTGDDVSDEEEAERRERYSLARLRLALKYEQKQVSHSHTLFIINICILL